MSTRFDEERRRVFLTKLRETLNASAAYRAAGVSKTIVYVTKREDPEFAQAWADAIEEGLDAAEQACNDRAFKGVQKPVFYKGELCGEWLDADGKVLTPDQFGTAVTFRPYTTTEYSDTLAQFMLKANRPEKFREKLDLNHSGGVALSVVTGVPDPNDGSDLV